MEKTLACLIDELVTADLKIYHLVEKVEADQHTREDALKLQKLNRLRSELMNAISESVGEKGRIIKL